MNLAENEIKNRFDTPNAAVTLAIFPFENLTEGREFDIFCKAFSLDLITEFSRFSQFQIINRQVVPSNSDQQVQNTSSIDYSIFGSFRSDKERIRINVQLLDAQTNRLVWANRFEGAVSELQDLQESLQLELVSSLQQQLNMDLLSQMRKKPKVALKAYEYWLYGMEELKKGSLKNDLIARDYFQQALELEPDYSLAYSGMSLTYFNEWSCQLWDQWEVCKSGAFEWAQKAIERDDQNYIASLVLGKIFLFDESYETAEYYFRRSLQLNSNDPETLIPIAAYLIYLDYKDEAIALYEKALRLNPVKASTYMGIGAFIFFELGEFSKAASLVHYSANASWADAEAYHAAIFYYLKDEHRMRTHWDAFLENYQENIRHGEPYTLQEAIKWLVKINPHKRASNLDAFLAYISNGEFKKPALSRRITSEPEVEPNSFFKAGDVWKITYEGTSLQLMEVKGFYDIQRLLTNPDQCLHCAELMGSVLESKGETVIDGKARKAYRQELLDLQQEIEAAEAANDFARLSMLQSKYDQLIEHLTQSLGLRGNIREVGNPIEKARSAVTWRIRSAIAKIEKVHPALGKHLVNSIKTGTVCKYSPEQVITWVTEA